ncbi:MAG: YggU family protein [Methanomassiliicoccales archaeon]|jgi:uncharacterized protein (TIGR00251 family)|nr:YggU family protein [Methanomassiliicoccales archaeon]
MDHEKIVRTQAVAKETPEGVVIELIVSPGAKSSKIEGLDRWRNRLVVRVTSPPERGKANEELQTLLSDFFESDVEIVKGYGSRLKTVLVRRDFQSVESRLKGLNEKSS